MAANQASPKPSLYDKPKQELYGCIQALKLLVADPTLHAETAIKSAKMPEPQTWQQLVTALE